VGQLVEVRVLSTAPNPKIPREINSRALSNGSVRIAMPYSRKWRLTVQAPRDCTPHVPSMFAARRVSDALPRVPGRGRLGSRQDHLGPGQRKPKLSDFALLALASAPA
jgi:hypothetical protein